MKHKKSVCAVMAALMLAAAVFAFVAGGDETGGGGGGGSNGGPNADVKVTEKAQTYTMEAEYIDLSGVVGSGLSNSAFGVKMITGNGTQAEKDKGWSEGYYVSQTHLSGCRLDFVFDSGAAEKTTITVRLSSELGTLNFTPDSLGFLLNDKELPYGTFQVKGGKQLDLTAAVFNDYTIAANVTLQEGENAFSIVVRDNNLRGNAPAGPMVDCVKFTTKSVLSWTDHKDNISKRDTTADL